jgi:hypothetical protein
MTPQEAIRQVVSNGKKAVELVTEVNILLSETGSEFPTDLPAIIDQMVKDGELVEIEYVLPDMNYRIKSFYLPKGTEIISVGSTENA